MNTQLVLIVTYIVMMFPALAWAAEESATKDGLASMLGMAGIGLVLGWISKGVARYWEQKRPGLEEWATTLDDRLEAAMKKRFGVGLPNIAHDVWDAGARTGIGAADVLAHKGPLVRNVIRAAIARDPVKALAIIEEIKGIKDWSGYFYDQLSPETRQLFNLEKKALAVGIAKASVKASEAAKAGDIETLIDAKAAATKDEKAANLPDLTPESAAALADELRAEAVAKIENKPEVERWAARMDAGEDTEKLLQDILAKMQAKRLARAEMLGIAK